MALGGNGRTMNYKYRQMKNILAIKPIDSKSSQSFQLGISINQSGIKRNLDFVVSRRKLKNTKVSELAASSNSATQVCEKLNALLAGSTVYCERYAQNLELISQLFESAGIMREFQVRPIEKLIPEISLNAWIDCKQRLFAQLGLDASIAKADASVSAKILERLAGESLPIYSAQLDEWCKSFTSKSVAQSKVA